MKERVYGWHMQRKLLGHVWEQQANDRHEKGAIHRHAARIRNSNKERKHHAADERSVRSCKQVIIDMKEAKLAR